MFSSKQTSWTMVSVSVCLTPEKTCANSALDEVGTRRAYRRAVTLTTQHDKVAVIAMNQTCVKLPFHRAAAAFATVLIGILCADPASADGHRARLSRDLADRIATGAPGSTDVILIGNAERIRSVAARYGANLKKTLRTGAVLEVTSGQLDALSQDPDVAQVSGDVAVTRMMAVTPQAGGADQVWSGGGEGVPGFNGPRVRDVGD